MRRDDYASKFYTKQYSDGSGSCHRAIYLPYLVAEYKKLKYLPGHEDWSVYDADTVGVRFAMNVEFDMVTDGYSETTALPADHAGTYVARWTVLYTFYGTACAAAVTSQKRIGTTKDKNSGRELPVYEAVQIA